MGKAEHLTGEADPKSQADVKSLMAEFLASTRNPIGASGLFSDPFEAPPTEADHSKVKRSHPRGADARNQGEPAVARLVAA